MSQRVLTSLGILNVNWSNRQDYIDLFLPFVAESLRSSDNDIVSLPALQDDIKSQFGLCIPQNALGTILKRAYKQGMVRSQHGVYYRSIDNLGNHSAFQSQRANLERQFQALIVSLTTFVKTELHLDWSSDEAELQLWAYLEEHSIPVLAASVSGLPIVQPNHKQIKSLYPVYSFVKHLSECDPNTFQFLVAIVKGRMLADVLLYPDFGNVKQQFSGVEIYLDTPFLLEALGYGGPSLSAPCIELLEMLRQQNARLYVFTHNSEEIYRVLDACEHNLRANARSSTNGSGVLNYFRTTNVSPGDVALLKVKLEQNLQHIGVRIKDAPRYTNPLGVDELKLHEALQAEINYRDNETREKDVASLTAIHRLRNGEAFPRIETCKAIFVTNNDKLARVSAEFFKRQYGGTTVPYCMLDHILTTLAWLKSATPPTDLPEKRVIANCYAAINPPEPLWHTYLTKINELAENKHISPEDYAVLRYDTSSRKTLMDMTLGDPDCLTEGTIEELLEHSRAEARRETEEQLRQEEAARQIAEQKVASETEARAKVEDVLRRTSEEHLQIKDVLKATEQRASQAEMLIQRQRQDVHSTAKRYAIRIANGVRWICIAALLLEVIHALPFTAPYVHPLFEGVWKWLFHGLSIVAALLYLFHAVRGKSINEIVEWLEETIASKIEVSMLTRRKLPIDMTMSAVRSIEPGSSNPYPPVVATEEERH